MWLVLTSNYIKHSILASSWLQWISNKDLALDSMPLMNENSNIEIETFLLKNTKQTIKEMEIILADLEALDKPNNLSID
jgi:uncharacterized protein YqcC (DUF446 family)